MTVFKKPLALLLLAFGLSAFALAPIAFAEDPPASKEKHDEDNSPDARDTFKYLSLFSDVLERTRADYVDSITDEKLIENALNGMLSSLDPHSGYLNKKNFQEMQTQTRGEFGGLGIEVTMQESIVKVVSPIDDTPAAKAGLQPGDLITHLDEHPVTELTLSEAVDRMRGPPGTKIKLTIRRGGLSGKPFDVTLTRAIIRIKSVKYELKDDNIGYVRVTTFNEQTQSLLDAALDDLDKKAGKKLIGYVVDLRNNPGGLLEQAISVSSTFLPSGVPVVSTRGRHQEDNQVFLSKGGDRAAGKPVVVMINGGSASASEIVSGALQDHHRAILVGTKSFGKGSVQTIIPLQNGGAMRLTTARYYTPSGRSIQAEGIQPDIVVQPAKIEEIKVAGKALREADLRGALTNDQLKKGKPSKESPAPESLPGPDADKDKDKDKDKAKDKKSSGEDDLDADDVFGEMTPPGKEKPFDYQLARALDLLRGIALYEKRSGATQPPKPAADASPASDTPQPDSNTPAP
ncbi:MAG TPA: S41 family peptidase [Alphaproteobacteria bacterium]|nr:S41 family peptidase [Alphaproteobacteria bacterium]